MTTGRILHLGLGAFHRAHQAVYLQHLRNLGDRDWSIVATNLRDDGDAVLAALERQGGRYTVETVSPAGDYRYEAVDVIDTILRRDARLTEVIGCGADPLRRRSCPRAQFLSRIEWFSSPAAAAGWERLTAWRSRVAAPTTEATA